MAVREHVKPPRVLSRGRHVVGYEIDDEPEVVPPQRFDHPFEVGEISQRRIEPAEIDHIVPVRGSCPGGKYRRGVDMADAEAGEVGRKSGGGGEVHAVAELKAVGGAWCGHCRAQRRATIMSWVELVTY